MNQLLQDLELHGCDIAGSLRRFANSEDLYLKYLYRFPTEETLARFQAALAGNAYEEAHDAIHTFKGITGNLGLTELYEYSQVILQLLRDEKYEDIAACAGNLAEAHAQLVSIICSHTASEA